MNKPSKLLIGLAVAAAGVLGAGAAFAHGGRVHFGIGLNFGPYWGPYWGGPYWGGPYWGPAYYYPAPVYYPTPVVVAPPSPPVYVERNDQAPQAGYWYYCETARGYYPYVKECPSGWKAVPPAPAPAR